MKKIPFLAAAAAAVALTVLLLLKWEATHILGVKTVETPPEVTGSLDFTLTLNGCSAPYDSATDLWFIPQSLTVSGWSGRLDTAEGFSLCFADSELFDRRAAAVAQCTVFELYVTDGQVTDCARVIFTGLPALCIENGSLTVFCPDGSGDRGAVTVQSCCTLNIRESGDLWEKSSYKLTLTDASGGYAKAQLLGMAADDDWLLLPMCTDRTCLREKTAMDLWNEISARSPYSLETGASCAYAELFLDGQYRGLYLLAQRIDGKLTGADTDDTVCLFSGSNIPSPEDFALAPGFFCRDLEIRSTHTTFTSALWQDTALWTEAVFYSSDPELLAGLSRQENLYDYVLFTQLVSSPGEGFQSFCVVFHHNGSEQTDIVIPTDFTYSFGSVPHDYRSLNYTAFDIDTSRNDPVTAAASALPGFAEGIADRYKALSDLLNETHLQSMLAENERYLTESGALVRNLARWPDSDKGPTRDNLNSWISARLSEMEEEYAG